MAMSSEKVIKRRLRLEEKKKRNQEKLQALKDKLKRDSQRIIQAQRKEESEKVQIAGKFIIEKIRTDTNFKIWFQKEVASSSMTTYEKNLFEIISSHL